MCAQRGIISTEPQAINQDEERDRVLNILKLGNELRDGDKTTNFRLDVATVLREVVVIVAFFFWFFFPFITNKNVVNRSRLCCRVCGFAAI